MLMSPKATCHVAEANVEINAIRQTLLGLELNNITFGRVSGQHMVSEDILVGI